MSTDSPSTLRLEIGHVLFIDIVGYSKLLINEQGERLRKLNELVRQTAEVRAAEAENKLIRLPTGDGMALVFRDSPEAPARGALELAAALKEHPDIPVRMGIHSGPINEIADVNDRENIAGGGINIAQRVMDCGDAGHILLSKRVADDLCQYREWQTRLHDLGECEAKHGVRLAVSNLYTDEVGNRAVPTKLRDKNTGASSRRSRYYSLGAVLVLLLGVALLAVFLLSRKSSTPVATPVGAGEKRIAVLPFRPLVPEERDQVLELGMADTLIAKLSNSRAIIVASLASVRKFANLDVEPISAGRELGVSSVLEGSVQRAGDQIRVTARLINVADGRSLWSDTFDEKFTDVFTVQNAISQKVADALALRLSGEERNRLTRHETENLEAYQLYLTGRYHYARLIPPEIRTAIGFFEKAIALDPRYALAYFGLAECYRSLAITSDVPSKDSLPQAKVAAQKALEIDESLAEAHASLSFTVIWFDWDWALALKEAKRAIALNPNSAYAHFAYAHVLSDLGHHDEAIAENTRACEIEPVYLLFHALQGMFLHLAGRDDEAYFSLQKTLALDPTFWITRLTLGKVLLQQRKYAEAIAEFEQARDLSHGNSEAIASIGYAAARAGDTGRARGILDELKRTSEQSYVPPVTIALVYNGLGETEEALSWLERGCDERDVRLTLLKVDPKWNSFRSNSRFLAILKRIGLN
ncbi:MAG: tetratricopeptide repeat protein [Verrucomicrobiota bacterium]|nr:tetratricopeptide repeat protein [Verrucomicrobiota bacterium]